MATQRIYGLLAEFETPDQLLSAAHIVREAGYRSIDAFSPMPIEGLAEAVGFSSTRLPLVVLVAGMFGAAAGFFLQWYANVHNFRIDDFMRRTGDGIRNAGHERLADAVPPTLQRAALRLGHAGTLFSLHQGSRQKIRDRCY
jgi:hypothetical protein